MSTEKHVETFNYKNPKYLIVYNQNRKRVIANPHYDPSKCERCGMKHGWFQIRCKPEDLK